jgi:hypothetical protein
MSHNKVDSIFEQISLPFKGCTSLPHTFCVQALSITEVKHHHSKTQQVSQMVCQNSSW